MSEIVRERFVSVRRPPCEIVLRNLRRAGYARTVVVRSSSESIPAVWPPSGGAVAIDSATSTNPATTDGNHTTVDGSSTVYYRALVLNAANQVLASSPVRSALTHGIEPKGALSVTPADGKVTFGWSAFGGPSDCFTTYKLVWSNTTTDPSYLGNHDSGALAIAGQSTNSLLSDAVAPGTYYFRVQAIRVTSLGKFIVAQTDAVEQTIP